MNLAGKISELANQDHSLGGRKVGDLDQAGQLVGGMRRAKRRVEPDCLLALRPAAGSDRQGNLVHAHIAQSFQTAK